MDTIEFGGAAFWLALTVLGSTLVLKAIERFPLVLWLAAALFIRESGTTPQALGALAYRFRLLR
ncbi:MAG: hypothetical protein FJY25_20310 [Betaproteobacteria bacterium]|nr:hypothetical protein [Betaproteobacteria bacterium]